MARSERELHLTGEEAMALEEVLIGTKTVSVQVIVSYKDSGGTEYEAVRVIKMRLARTQQTEKKEPKDAK